MHIFRRIVHGIIYSTRKPPLDVIARAAAECQPVAPALHDSSSHADLAVADGNPRGGCAKLVTRATDEIGSLPETLCQGRS